MRGHAGGGAFSGRPGGMQTMARGGMAVPLSRQIRGPGRRSPRGGQAAGDHGSSGAANDIFSALGPGIELLTEPIDRIDITPQALRKLTSKIEIISAEAAKVWTDGVEVLLSQPIGLKEGMSKLQSLFELLPVHIDAICSMLEIRRIQLVDHNINERRNKILAVAALGSYARAQYRAIQAAQLSDNQLYRKCLFQLRDSSRKGNKHHQLILMFMKTARGRRM